MSVIIRLQGLPWSASALDIRNFFRGLIIPQGGVHIIGGEKGDAFIAFSSDEDARQGMMRNMAALNGVPVQLFLSSKSEMQSIIDEARNRDVTSVAVAPAPVMPRGPTSGVGQGYQNQPYPVSQDMGNQRPPSQPNYPNPPEGHQGQFPGMQNVDHGQNQMQFPGQQMPDRANQYGVQGENQQDPYQQNVQSGKPKMGMEGQYGWTQGYNASSSDRNFGKDNQQKQWNAGGYGAPMEGHFEGQGANQWFQGGQEFGNKQNYYGDQQPPQGHGPGFQRDQPSEQFNPGAVSGQFQQQQQRRDQPYNADNFWQEGFNSSNKESFPGMAEAPGPQDVNRRGIMQRPGPGNEPPSAPNADHMPPRSGPGAPAGFPGMEQRPDMKMDQGRGQRGHPNEGYPPQAMEEGRFPPNRREGPPGRGGPQPGPFSDGPPKRGGILPTPDMANQDQLKDYSNEQFYNAEGMEQRSWADQHGDESQSHDPRRGRAGREADAIDASMGRGRSFEGPDSSRPRDRPRKSRFDQVDESPVERGPDGRPADRGFGSRPDERSTERGPHRRPLPEQERGQNRFEERPPRRRHDGPPFDRDRGEWSGPERRNQGRPFGGESDHGPDRRSLERGPGGDRDRSGMALDRRENRESMERGGERRPVKRGPDGRPKEEGLLGRAPDRRPLPGGPEGSEEHEGGFEKGRPGPGRRFDEPHSRFDGPPGGRFPPTEEYDPMEAEFNPDVGDQGMRGPARRGMPGPGGDFVSQGRGRGDRPERGQDRWNERPPGGRGFNRGRPDRGQGRPPFDQSEEEFGHQFAGKERFEDGDFGEEDMHRDPFRNQTFSGDIEQFNRGEGGPRHGRPMRGPERPYNDRNMDRQQRGHSREEMDTHMRDRRREQNPEEGRLTGKGLLGDAPGGLLPTPHFPGAPEAPQPLMQNEDDFHRDREARAHRSREDRERDERRRSDHRHTRDRSPNRERRRGRSRDRSEHRDRSSNRDSKDSGYKGAEKSGRSNRKPEEQIKITDSKFIYAKGFPAAYTTTEIQRFFFGCDLLFTGIKIVKNAHGQRTGEVYLEFPNVDEAKKAIAKNGETIFGTPVALTFTSKKEFDEKTKMPPSSTEKDKASSASPVTQKDNKGSNIVLIQGLPPNIKREDLANLFSAVKLASVPKPLFIEYDDKTLATGTAYLVTASPKDFETAIGYDGHILGSKALQLSAGNQNDMDACIAKSQEIKGLKVEQPIALDKLPAGAGIMGARPPLMGVAPKMPARPSLFGDKPSLPVGLEGPRNGPASAFEPNMNFPRPHQEERLPLIPGPEDRPPRFHGPDDRPPRFHGPGERPPRFPGPGERPPRFHAPDERPPRFPGPDDRPPRFRGPPRVQGPGFCVQIQGLPMLATYNDIRLFFSGLNIAAHRGVQIVHDGNSKPTGEAFVEFDTQEDKEEALKRDKTSLGSQIVAVKSVAKPDMIERLRKARLTSVRPGQDGPAPRSFPPRRLEAPFMNVPSHLLNPRLFYVACQNFPQGVTVPDIVEFFQDYNPDPDSIRQLYGDDGTSTGNAVVGFFNREEAEMALDEMNGVLCGQSMVALQPVKG